MFSHILSLTSHQYFLVIIILNLLFAACTNAIAQDDDFERMIEGVLATQDENLNYEEVAELLYQRYADPVDLNLASPEDLTALMILSDRQLSNLLHYREKYGALLSIYELQYIPGWDEQTIRKLLPFVSVSLESRPSAKLTLKDAMARSNKIFLYRQEATLEQKKGYQTDSLAENPSQSKYIGGPNRFYTRFRMSHAQRFSAGLTLEKDAGEQIAWNPERHQYGADYWSAHVYLAYQGRLKKAVVGDYHLHFGQGLVFGSGFGMGKGVAGIHAFGAKNIGIQPYTSTIESGFFRGGAATYALPLGKHTLDITGFYSSTKQDAQVNYDSMQNLRFFATKSITGYHRTENERSNRKKLNENALGSHLLFNSAGNHFHAGVGYVATQYSAAMLPSAQLYRLYEFSGKQNFTLSTHADFTHKNINMYAEAATSKNGGTGAMAGLTAYFSSAVQMAWVARHYTPDFHAFYGSALSENSRPINEKGLYWGLDLKPWKKVMCSAYYDYFQFPWLRYGADAPGNGYEYVIKTTYDVSSQTKLLFQLGTENKATNVSGSMQKVMPGLKKAYRLNLKHAVSERLRLQTRMQMSRYELNDISTQGFAVAQDITLNFGRLRADLRYAVFQTDDYATRQYVYEQDVLYAFSIPVYSGAGTRSYVVLRYKFNRYVHCWLRAAQWQYDDREETGSGLEAINGNTRTDVRFQLAIKF